jgi:hypothetical protein
MSGFFYDDDAENKEPHPASPEAEAFASALLELIKADRDLEHALLTTRTFTTAEKRMVTQERDAWNRAAERLYSLVADKKTGQE